MRVTHLRGVTVESEDPAELCRFYEASWGLTTVAEHDGTFFLRGSGPEHHILTIAPGERARLVGYSLALASRASVDEAAVEVAEHPGVVIVRPPGVIDAPGGGYGLSLTDVDGRLVDLSADVERAGPFETAAEVAPTKVSHLVVNSPAADDYARFLVDVLGFELADEMPHMSFFRCNADHHSIAVARAPHASLNHVAFEVPTTEDVLRGVRHLGESVRMIWGPNRHGPGHNVFGYFVAPNDQVIEYTAEVEQVDLSNPPAARLWLPEDSEVVDEWADPITLRPTSEAREAMLGAAEPPSGPPSSVSPLDPPPVRT